MRAKRAAAPTPRLAAKIKGAAWYASANPCDCGRGSRRFVTNNKCVSCIEARECAKAFGRNKFNGAPCTHGHSGVRFTANGSCAPCALGYIKSRGPEWYQRRVAKLKAGRDKHPEIHRARNNAWKRRHPEKVTAWHARRRALQLQASPLWADNQKIAAIYRNARWLTKKTGVRFEVDHIYPLKGRDGSRGLHVHENLHAVPHWLNRAKSNRAPM